MRKLAAACVVALSCGVPAAARAAEPAGPAGVAGAQGAAGAAKVSGTFQINGGGFGHGIGMSQYGAMGYAEHGWTFPEILAHYYQGTSLARVPNSTVTVLLKQGGATFSGASAANGVTLSPAKRYGVLVTGGKLQLISGGRRSASFTPPLKVSGANLSVTGSGRYAGSLEFYPAPSGGGVLTVNAVDLEDYVRGVVTEESPASWPEQALEAQAVAARTYVLADAPASSEYQVYSDTRSQVYGGISAETTAGNTAVADTVGQVVESAGRVVPTYFFSSSAGHTEDIQDVWLGTTPVPYLTGVSDPYDDAGDDPYYRWTDTLSLSAAARRLAGLYRGTFEGIKVLRHGTSPRIVTAAVIGTGGRTTVAGTTLQDDLGTMSTWMSFTTVTAHGTVSSGSGAKQTAPTGATTTTGTTAPSTGGAGIGGAVTARGARAVSAARVVSGSVFPAVRGARVTVERAAGAGWVSVGRTRVSGGGRYALNVGSAGVYRAVYRGAAAPTVTLR